jgi:TPR repeat protein
VKQQASVDPEAKVKLANHYLELAADLLKKATEANLPNARVQYGLVLLSGLGAPENHIGAVEQFRLASNNPETYSRGLYHLGLCYEGGLGATENKKLAYKMYKKGLT